MNRSSLPSPFPSQYTKPQTAYNEKEARDVIHTLLAALAYCHDNRIVHRDIKARASLVLICGGICRCVFPFLCFPYLWYM